jgi:rhodanese-related sulfurtransferase
MNKYKSQSDHEPISAQELKLKLDNGALIVDLRYINTILSTGSIPNSIFIGIQGNIESWAYYLIENKAEEIYLLIEAATDINEVVSTLSRIGFTNIKGYLKDLEFWVEAGFKTESYNLILPNDFINKFEEIDPNLIIDVRTEREFENQHIVGSQNIPLNSLIQGAKSLNPDQQYYLICAGGYRSIIAASILKRLQISKTIDVYGGLKNFP